MKKRLSIVLAALVLCVMIPLTAVTAMAATTFNLKDILGGDSLSQVAEIAEWVHEHYKVASTNGGWIRVDTAKNLVYNGKGQTGYSNPTLMYIAGNITVSKVTYYKYEGIRASGDFTDWLVSGYADNVFDNPHWKQVSEAKDAGLYAVYIRDDKLNIDNMIGNNLPVFEIAKKQLTLDWSNTEFEYDGKEHAPTAKLNGVASGDDYTLTVEGAAKEVGTHTAHAVITFADEADADNYIMPTNLDCDFVIKAAGEKVEPKKDTPKTDPIIPATGSESAVLPVVAVLAVGFCAFGAAVVYANKKKVFGK